jgi:hypothetical protein
LDTDIDQVIGTLGHTKSCPRSYEERKDKTKKKKVSRGEAAVFYTFSWEGRVLPDHSFSADLMMGMCDA